VDSFTWLQISQLFVILNASAPKTVQPSARACVLAVPTAEPQKERFSRVGALASSTLSKAPSVGAAALAMRVARVSMVGVVRVESGQGMGQGQGSVPCL